MFFQNLIARLFLSWINIPLYGYMTLCLSIHLLKDILNIKPHFFYVEMESQRGYHVSAFLWLEGGGARSSGPW